MYCNLIVLVYSVHTTSIGWGILPQFLFLCFVSTLKGLTSDKGFFLIRGEGQKGQRVSYAGACVFFSVLLLPGWLEVEVLEELEAAGHCLTVAYARNTLPRITLIWGPIPAPDNVQQSPDFFDGSKDHLTRYSCGVTYVRIFTFKYFTSPDLLWSPSWPHRFQIANIKHVQYLRSDILLCVGNPEDSW